MGGYLSHFRWSNRRGSGVLNWPAQVAFKEAGHSAEVAEVFEDRKRGLVAHIKAANGADREAIGHLLGEFVYAHDWAE